MSFSFTTAPTAPDATAEAIEAILEAQPGVKAVVGELASTIAMIAQVVGPTIAREGDTVVVSAYGHWNGGKDPVAGWASNALTVNVVQVYPKPEEG